MGLGYCRTGTNLILKLRKGMSLLPVPGLHALLSIVSTSSISEGTLLSSCCPEKMPSPPLAAHCYLGSS